jgi:adenine-specific DNA-methyltransferase
MARGRSNGNGGKKDKQVTRYTYDDIKEPRTPETGHTALLPAEEQVVTVPMDNGWGKSLQVGKLPEADVRPIVVDMDPAVDPFLLWAGKRSKRDVPVLPLQRNEIVSESRIAQIIERTQKAAAEKDPQPRQATLFADLEKSLRETDKKRRIEFYTHDEGWKNKLICGDSLHVMESLLHYEALRGKVQMIYIDPPYGIKYDSNFQQRIDSTKNDGADEADDVLTIKAFRDTWALGVHSYLSYLQERLYLCRELLTSTGSVFVQISDENVHRVRALMDEVFGANNFISQITFFKTTSQSSDFLSAPVDYLLWYAKEKANCSYRQLYREKELGGEGTSQYTWVELPDGTRRPMTDEELKETKPLPKGARIFCHDNLCSTRQGRAHEIWSVKFGGREYWPVGASTWKTNQDGMERLKKASRLIGIGNTLRYVRYLDDFKAFPITGIWMDTVISGFAGEKFYVVQTSPKVVTRCIAMTTSPGDLVLDITSGGGTTAYCAELLGRRWVVCDTSRVAMNITRQRLLGAVFPAYVLKGDRVSSGLRYRELQRVTMGSITSEREPERVELVDDPIVDASALRVAGPFEVMSLGRYSVEDWKGYVTAAEPMAGYGEAAKLENYIDVICRLYRKGAAVQGASGLVHAVAESGKERIAISVGPLSGRVTAKQINDAVQDALSSGILEVHVLGWAFEANVGEVKSQLESRGKVKVELIMIRPDTLAEGLKATQPEMLFSPLALPDVDVKVKKGKNGGEAIIKMKGVALFDRKARTTSYKNADSGYISAWYLDEDYDGDCFVDCQMFFDFKKAPNLKAALRAEIEADEYKLQLESRPFPVRGYKRVAVKVVDVYGNESTVVRALE